MWCSLFKNIESAFVKSFQSDPKSAFGGIIFLNRKVSYRLAKIIIKSFFEMVVASSFEEDAIKILKKKRNLILLKIPSLKNKII